MIEIRDGLVYQGADAGESAAGEKVGNATLESQRS